MGYQKIFILSFVWITFLIFLIPHFTPPAFFVKQIDPLRINFSTKKGYRPLLLRKKWGFWVPKGTFKEVEYRKMMQTKFAG